MRVLILAAVAAVLAPAAGSAAQTPAPGPTPAVRAMAAGYKALTICSALKTAEAAGGERTLESVEANELVGIYPELDALVREMPVEIFPARVAVAWDPDMPPRSAVWRGGRGCAVMPVGWTGEEIAIRPPWRPADLPFTSGDPAGNAALLNEAVEQAFEGDRYGEGINTTAVLVLQDDRIVAEEYALGFGPNTPQRTWSVAKSLAGTVIGAAVQRGEADVNAPAAIGDWSTPGDPRAAITLDQLMRMASGLTSDTAGNRTDALYFGGVGIDEQVTTWPLIARPGTRFRYANNDILLAILSIEPTFADHPPAELFRRLGMNDTWAESD